MKSFGKEALPLAAKKVLKKLGSDIAIARKKRRISTVSMAERAFISRPTLQRVERGDPAVSIGIYLSVLNILGLAEKIGDVADRREDHIGLNIDESNLPKRIAL